MPERIKGWEYASPKQTRYIRKLESVYFRRRVRGAILWGMFFYGCGLLFLLPAVFLLCTIGENGEQWPLGSMAVWAGIYSALFAAGLAVYFRGLRRKHSDFMNRDLYCRKVVCAGKTHTRYSSYVDLMTEEDELLEMFPVPEFVMADLKFRETAYLAVTDAKLCYEFANLYPVM